MACKMLACAKQIYKRSVFHVGAIFEMSTVLYGIRLLIDKVKTHDRVFISNNFCREECKSAERQKERECERQCVGRYGR